MRYFVTGGEFADTQFTRLLPGTDVRKGPFDYARALDEWRGLSMQSIDNCMVRYFLVPESGAESAASARGEPV